MTLASTRCWVSSPSFLPAQADLKESSLNPWVSGNIQPWPLLHRLPINHDHSKVFQQSWNKFGEVKSCCKLLWLQTQLVQFHLELRIQVSMCWHDKLSAWDKCFVCQRPISPVLMPNYEFSESDFNVLSDVYVALNCRVIDGFLLDGSCTYGWPALVVCLPLCHCPT